MPEQEKSTIGTSSVSIPAYDRDVVHNCEIHCHSTAKTASPGLRKLNTAGGLLSVHATRTNDAAKSYEMLFERVGSPRQGVHAPSLAGWIIDSCDSNAILLRPGGKDATELYTVATASTAAQLTTSISFGGYAPDKGKGGGMVVNHFSVDKELMPGESQTRHGYIVLNTVEQGASTEMSEKTSSHRKDNSSDSECDSDHSRRDLIIFKTRRPERDSRGYEDPVDFSSEEDVGHSGFNSDYEEV